LPNIKSAEKRVKVIKTKTLRNQMIRSALKTSVKSFEAALLSDDKEKMLTAFRSTVKKIDTATAKGVIHKNTGARKKSALALKLNKAQ